MQRGIMVLAAVCATPFVVVAPPPSYALAPCLATSTVADGSASYLLESRLWAWGSNAFGQLGDGTTNDRLSPVPLQWDVTAVSGTTHSLRVTVNGDLYAVGDNSYGQLGDGTTTNRTWPVPVSNLSGVRSVAAGGGHSLALRTDGNLYTWGRNDQGQLGNGTLTPTNTPGAAILSHVAAIAAGPSYSLALLDQSQGGQVLAWGDNWYGQLGNGTYNDSLAPRPVFGLTGVVAIAAGFGHALAVTSDGSVWAWGSNYYGELGNGSRGDTLTKPVLVLGIVGATQVAAGVSHSLALVGGKVLGWGANSDGQLGDGTRIDQLHPVPAQGVTGASYVSAGSYHSMASTGATTPFGAPVNGPVWTWGYNRAGQLGDGTTNSRPVPAPVLC